MDRRISIKNCVTYQLISLAIEIVDNIMYLEDCESGLIQSNKHLEKAHKLSVRWNELFLDAFISKKSVEVSDHE